MLFCFRMVTVVEPSEHIKQTLLFRDLPVHSFIDPAALSLHQLRINPTGNRGENLGGSLFIDPWNGTDMRRLELLRKLLQYNTPIDSITKSAGCTLTRPANSDISISSERDEFSPVISQLPQFRLLGADLLIHASQDLASFPLNLMKCRADLTRVTAWHSSNSSCGRKQPRKWISSHLIDAIHVEQAGTA